jgi:iron(III) transport system permease protein
MFLLAPIGVLVYWSVHAVELGYGVTVAWEAALSSLSVCALAAAVAMLAVLPVAFLSHRYPSGWTRTTERLAFTGNALPGIVIALSLVFFAANYVAPLYQTLALLVFAYVVRLSRRRSRGSALRCTRSARTSRRLREASGVARSPCSPR